MAMNTWDVSGYISAAHIINYDFCSGFMAIPALPNLQVATFVSTWLANSLCGKHTIWPGTKVSRFLWILSVLLSQIAMTTTPHQMHCINVMVTI